MLFICLGVQIISSKEKTPSHKLKWPFMWFCEITWQSEVIIYPLPPCLWLPNLIGWWPTLNSCYQSHDNLKILYPTTTIPMTTRTCRMMTYREGFLAIISPALSSSGIAKSRDKLKLSPQPQCLWPPDLSGWWVSLSGSYL